MNCKAQYIFRCKKYVAPLIFFLKYLLCSLFHILLFSHRIIKKVQNYNLNKNNEYDAEQYR